MSSVKIEFDTDNAAFRDENGSLDTAGIAEVLAQATAKIHSGLTEGPLKDYNGNRVGHFQVTED